MALELARTTLLCEWMTCSWSRTNNCFRTRGPTF